MKKERMKWIAVGALGCCETCILAGLTVFAGVVTKECVKRALKKEVK